MGLAGGKAPCVAIVVVNWNGADDTIACLRSLKRLHYPERRVYVVDNSSTDDSPARIRAAHPDVTLLAAERNLGYAAGCNFGLTRALEEGADYVWLLNNDTLVEPGTLDALLEADERYGPAVSSPKILTQDRPDEIWYAGGYLDWQLTSHHIGRGDLDRGQHDEARQVAWASGCSLFCPAPVARQLGPLDERYFLYLEDVDWCLRARSLGIPVWYIPQARVFHGVSRSVGRLDERHLRYYSWRNYYMLVTAHGTWWQRLYGFTDLASRFIKITMRMTLFPAYRRSRLYHARTRGLLDFVRGRTGAAPFVADHAAVADPRLEDVRS